MSGVEGDDVRLPVRYLGGRVITTAYYTTLLHQHTEYSEYSRSRTGRIESCLLDNHGFLPQYRQGMWIISVIVGNENRIVSAGHALNIPNNNNVDLHN